MDCTMATKSLVIVFVVVSLTFALLAQENALKEQLINAEKALQNAQSKDMSSVLKELNDKRARLDEIDIFLGRVEPNSPAVERAIARYGDEYQAIIAEKFAKEDAQSGASDIVFAPKRENLGIMSNKNDKESKMPNFEFTTPDKDKTAFELRPSTIKALEKISSKPITNKNDGVVAFINRTGRRKMTSDEAIKESQKSNFTAAQHLEVVKRVDELFENSRLREIQPDKNGDPNLQMRRYEVKFMLDNEKARAKITLKETLSGMYKGNKIYTLELESVSKVD